MEERKIKDNSYETTVGAYKVCENVFKVARLGVFGGLILGAPNFAIVALAIAVLFNNAKKGAYSEISTCEEYQRINEIFEFVYTEMKKNIDTFKYSSIEDIYAYFNYILTNRYLSYDPNKLDVLYNQKIYCEPSILEAITLNDHGQCRNISPILTRLLSDYGHEATNISCNFRQEKLSKIDFDNDNSDNNIDQPKCTLEQLKKASIPHMDYIISEYKKKYPSKPAYFRSHMITQANDETYTYYLDASIPQIYIPIPNRPEEYVSPIGNAILISNQKERDNFGFFSIREHILKEKEFKDAFEVMYHLAEIERNLEENLDVIESFHKDIKPALEEAESIYQHILVPSKQGKNKYES